MDDVEINLSEVDITKFSADTIPYRVVQDPGRGKCFR